MKGIPAIIHTLQLKWYRKRASRGNKSAQVNLGYMYGRGQGVTRDYQEAVKWYRKSAEQGYPRGQCNLGCSYLFGHGVPQDYKTALEWFKLSAEQGDVCAQYNLGIIYASEQFGLQDKIYAYMWFSVVASRGKMLLWLNGSRLKERALEKRASVKGLMTSAEIAKAQRLAQEYIADNFKGCWK